MWRGILHGVLCLALLWAADPVTAMGLALVAFYMSLEPDIAEALESRSRLRPVPIPIGAPCGRSSV